VYVNNELNNSPIYIGDFILISKTNVLPKFYDEVVNAMTNDMSKIENWYNYYKFKQDEYPNGSFSLSCYTHQGLYAYFLYTRNITYDKLSQNVVCSRPIKKYMRA
jgi:hypothetical protein